MPSTATGSFSVLGLSLLLTLWFVHALRKGLKTNEIYCRGWICKKSEHPLLYEVLVALLAGFILLFSASTVMTVIKWVSS